MQRRDFVKAGLFASGSMLLRGQITGASPEHRARLREIPLKDIRIDDKFWSPRLQVNRTATLDHVYRELEVTGCIRNFDIAAKKGSGEFGGPWWADSDVYKWIEGASYAIGSRRDTALEQRLDDLISRIAAAQQSDGYLNTHVQIEEPDLRFRNLAFFHEDFSSGHLFEAAVAHYEATGQKNLLQVATRLADCFDATFGPGKRDGLSGHEGIELAWIRLYRATGERRYLRLAEFYLNQRGRKPSVFQHEYESLPADRTVLWRQGRPIKLRALQEHFFLAHPPAFDTTYCQDHLPVREQSTAVGHAVRAMFLYSGMADVAYETGDEAMLAALDRLYDSVTLKRMYVTGGIGPSARNEGFTNDYDLPNENAYQETCASAGMVLWTHRLFKLTGDGRYIDQLENSLYNAVLAGVSLEGNTFCYATPLACDQKFQRQPWFEVPCCPTTVSRFLPSIGRYSYSQSPDTIWVNLYLGSQATMKLENGRRIQIEQVTNYPWDGRVQLRLSLSQPEHFNVCVRVPGWAHNYKFTVNGNNLTPQISKGYAQIRRVWRPNDLIELSMALPVEKIQANPNVLACRGKLALRRGPLIYSLEQSDNNFDLERLTLSESSELTAQFNPALLGGVVVVTGRGSLQNSPAWQDQLYRPATAAGDTPVSFRAIPYCVWGNRGQENMKVWIDTPQV